MYEVALGVAAIPEVCMYIYIHICQIHINYTCLYMNVYMHLCMDVCIHICIYIYIKHVCGSFRGGSYTRGIYMYQLHIRSHVYIDL
jgi:hypothetical protein